MHLASGLRAVSRAGVARKASMFIGAWAVAGSALAMPSFTFGSATLTFTDGIGGSTPVISSPLPGAAATQLIDSTVAANFTASGFAGMWHFEQPDLFGLLVPANTGVFQSDESGQANGAASTRISFSAAWQMIGQFGPTAYGWVNIPIIFGSVASGAGSYVQMDVTFNFSGGATRNPVIFSYTNSTPGPFSTSFFNSETLTPNFIGNGLSEFLSGEVAFHARGVGAESSISLGAVSGMVPEPSGWALLLAGGMLVLSSQRRRQRLGR